MHSNRYESNHFQMTGECMSVVSSIYIPVSIYTAIMCVILPYMYIINNNMCWYGHDQRLTRYYNYSILRYCCYAGHDASPLLLLSIILLSYRWFLILLCLNEEKKQNFYFQHTSVSIKFSSIALRCMDWITKCGLYRGTFNGSA